MFTGIIQALGKIERSEAGDGDIRLTIGCGDLDLAGSEIGDSIAVNGTCLTAVEFNGQSFVADVSVETMEKTSLGQLHPAKSKARSARVECETEGISFSDR